MKIQVIQKVSPKKNYYLLAAAEISVETCKRWKDYKSEVLKFLANQSS